MQNESDSESQIRRPLRRLFIGLTVALLVGLFVLWRIDNDRMAVVRAEIVDRLLPGFEIGIKPGRIAADAFRAIGEFSSAIERIAELEEENRQLRQWRETAIVLEQQNAALREIANVQLRESFSTISAQVAADTSAAFRNSVLVNVGRRNGISDGWAVVDGRGLVGRVSGVGRNSSRVILITDSSSRIPVKIKPTGARGIVAGQNARLPSIELVSNLNQINAGDSVFTSGEGGVFPADLLIGTVSVDQNNQVTVFLAADIDNLEFVNIVRSRPPISVEASGDILVAPPSEDAGQLAGQ